MSFYQYYETFRDNLRETLKYRPRDLTRYVKDLPDDKKAQMESYWVASECFCEVLVRFYSFIIDRERGDVYRARAALKEAVAFANTGLKAWPEDTVRKQFYIDFSSEAKRWMERQFELQQ